jgi:hypothetical protein
MTIGRRRAGGRGHGFQREDRAQLRREYGLPRLVDPTRTCAGAVVGKDDGLLVIRLDTPLTLRGISRDLIAVTPWRVEHEAGAEPCPPRHDRAVEPLTTPQRPPRPGAHRRLLLPTGGAGATGRRPLDPPRTA